MLAIAVLVDGCADHMRPQLVDFIVPVLVSGLSDAHPTVRKSACIAVSSLADELAEDVIKIMHPAILPPLFTLLDGDAAILAQATSALDSLVEGMCAEDICMYLPVLMEKFASLLTRPAEVGKESENNDLKGTVIGAIGSAAHASKEVCSLSDLL
jgi:vesicle coat complex subunit